MYNWTTKNRISGIINILNRYFFIILPLLVIFSYGQLLFMQPWQDDNALFFKLAHIEGPAGYLGTGPFGQGAYKYTATPYIPIYKIFGYSTVPYFLFNLILYFLTTLVVYKVFSKVLGEKSGKICGFIYAAGYIASDGFIRLYNSPITSLSIVLIGLLFLAYWNYYRLNKSGWYLAAVLLFFLSVEFARARTHYLIGVVILFELIFLAFKKPLKSILFSLVRLIPFASVFYYYFIRGADPRSGQIKNFITALLKGDFQQLYGFSSSWSNLIFPDWLINILSVFKFRTLWVILPVLAFILIIIFLRKNTKKKILTPVFVIALTAWTFCSRIIFSTDLLNLNLQEHFVVFCGGMLFILFASGYFAIEKNKKLYLFFLLWSILNIFAYSAYSPTVSYASINRYLAHSFFALIGLFGVFIVNQNIFRKNIIKGLIILWGVGNLISSVKYQNEILRVRSNPTKKFYTQLKNYVPQFEKGDLIYFDVADDMQQAFSHAFSVAQMPETTAIAWRYGIDRYDIRRVTKLKDLLAFYREGSFTDKDKNLVPLNKFYTFFYSAGELIDTTEETRDLFNNGGKEEAVFLGELENKNELTIPLAMPINSIVPSEIKISLSLIPEDPRELIFPYILNAQMAGNNLVKMEESRKLAFKYKKTMENIFSNMSVASNSDWENNVPKNVIDRDPETFWRAHRILWLTQGAMLTLDLKKVIQINRFVWVNVWPGSSPTEYIIQSSIDGINWQDLKKVSNVKRIDTKDPQVEDFSVREARFVRMTITKTLNSDSPQIAEAWVVPVEFSALNIEETESFLANPFGYIPNIESYNNTLSELGFSGTVQVYWRSNKNGSFVTDAKHSFNAVYDGLTRQYKLILPAGGTKIDSLKFVGSQIQGNLKLKIITARPLNIKEAGEYE